MKLSIDNFSHPFIKVAKNEHRPFGWDQIDDVTFHISIEAGDVLLIHKWVRAKLFVVSSRL